jgi:HAE1 family hydrophobic/amphiphilic exporter-1
MNLAELSVKRPVFITCIFLVILLLGILSYGRLSTELYPDVTFPVVNVVVPLPGAGPEEIENQISKPLENALSGLAGLRSLRSTNIQGAGIVTAVFTMDSDIRVAEQKVTEGVARVRGDFPSGSMEPSIRTIDPSDVPLMTLGLTAKLREDQLFDLADREIRPRLQQISKVGLVEIQGGRKREIEIDVDRDKLIGREMTLGEVVNRVGQSGMNIPSGEIDNSGRSTLVRSVGQFDSLADLARLPVRFVGNEGVTRLSDVATVRDGLTDETARVYVDGNRAIALKVYRQSGGDNISIARDLDDEVRKINAEYSAKFPGWNLSIVHDGTKPVRAGVNEAKLAIELGVVLTILVVFFFLGNLRSTLITGVALPNSLFGAFLLMWVAGFSLNITTLAALSLAVGLLIDDAIVVRESIFKRLEAGDTPHVAAIRGTKEVTLAVVATTLTVLSAFGPIAFLNGIIGQFFKEFGFTICFAMLISLLDSLTMAPMLSAYFAGKKAYKEATHALAAANTTGHAADCIAHQTDAKSAEMVHVRKGPVAHAHAVFEKYQIWQERVYLRFLNQTLKRPLVVIAGAALVFIFSLFVFNHIPKSFMPPAGAGEFQVLLDTPPGTSLIGTDALAKQIDQSIRARNDVESTVLSVGGDHGESNEGRILVLLKDHRAHSTSEVKDEVREQLKSISGINVAVQDIIDIGGGAGQAFTVNITGQDLNDIRKVSQNLAEALRKDGDLKDVDTSYRAGASELKVNFNPAEVEQLGVSTTEIGQELRLMLSGVVPAHFHQNGEQYDIRVRLREDQRDLQKDFAQIYIPNVNHRLVPLSSVSKASLDESPANIRRENRTRFIEVSADVDSHGKGLSHALDFTRNFFSSANSAIPPGISYEFAGQTRDFQDLLKSAITAVGLSIAFMYLVLASLYESFFIPLNIMLVLPLAVCGAFYALALTGSPVEINSMIGCILLLGVSAKNSILLVDHIQQSLRDGHSLQDSILDAGKVRLRPIMMTSFALIAGMLPVAIPLEEAARQRAGMAVAVIGGLVTSTLLTLVVVPAMYPYLLRFENWVKRAGRFVN